MPRKKQIYSGILAQPFVIPPADDLPFRNLPSVEEAEAARYNAVSIGSLERLKALGEHYQMGKPSFGDSVYLLLLILKMASTHVPGFTLVSAPPKGRGRPSRWNGVEGATLCFEVQRVLFEDGGSLLSACKKVAALPEYKGMSGATVHSRYREYCRGPMKNTVPIIGEVMKGLVREKGEVLPK